MQFNGKEHGEIPNRLPDNGPIGGPDNLELSGNDTFMHGTNSQEPAESDKAALIADSSKSIEKETIMDDTNNSDTSARDTQMHDVEEPESTRAEDSTNVPYDQGDNNTGTGDASGEVSNSKSTKSNGPKAPGGPSMNFETTLSPVGPYYTSPQTGTPSKEEASKKEPVDASAERTSPSRNHQQTNNTSDHAPSHPIPPPRVPKVPRHAYVSEEKDEESAQDEIFVREDTPADGLDPAPNVPLTKSFFFNLREKETNGQIKRPRQTQAEKERQLADSIKAVKASLDAQQAGSANPLNSSAAQSKAPSLSTRGSTLPQFVTSADEEDPQFTKIREAYEKKKSRGPIPFAEQIEFLKAAAQEKERKERIKRQIQQDTAEDEEDFQRADEGNLFLSDEDETSFDPEELDRQNQQRLRALDALGPRGGSTRKPARKKTQALPVISRRMMNESINAGIQGFQEQKAAKKRGRGRKSQDLDNSEQKGSTGDATSKRKRNRKVDDSEANGPPKKRGRKPRASAVGAIESLGDMFGSSARAAGAQDGSRSTGENPQILSTRKQEALKRMIAEVPTENQRIGRLDIGALDAATKNLTWPRRIKADPDNNGWKMKGMKSALENFQLIGVGRMRELERREGNPRGGIVADEMGLGKTVSMIANMVDGRDAELRPTLIVVPAALSQQWLKEIAKHTEEDTFEDVMIFDGKLKSRVPKPVNVLQRSDIVITTYHELRASWPQEKPPPHLSEEATKAWIKKQWEEKRGPLHRVMWLRVVLDECQKVKNTVAQTATAACGLFARHRWLMSGTIVTNEISEFYSFFRFLKVPFLGKRELFMQNFISDEKAQDRLRELLKTIMIRRTHEDKFLEKPLVKLPPKDQRTIDVSFTAFERAMYDVIYRVCCGKVRRYVKAKGMKVQAIHMHIFQLFTLLRQLTGHLFSCVDTLGKCLEPKDIIALFTMCDAEDPDRTSVAMNQVRAIFRELEPEVREESEFRAKTLLKDLHRHYKENGFLRSYRKAKEPEAENIGYVCSKCNEPLDEIWKAACEHIFCEGCLEALKDATDEDAEGLVTCPIATCQAPLDDVRQISKRALQKILASKAWDPAKFFHSAKTQMVEDLVSQWLDQDPQTKIIIFTQWLEMVNILSIVCQRQRWHYCTYTGSMTMDARNSAIETFKEESEKRILIMSLKAGGVGLNITEATKVILVDLFWNDAIEQQAKARVHRIGQTRPTELLRLAVNRSMDSRILDLQDRKLKDMTRVLNGDGTSDRSTVMALLELFEIDTEGENGNPNGFMLPDDGVDELVDGAPDEN